MTTTKSIWTAAQCWPDFKDAMEQIGVTRYTTDKRIAELAAIEAPKAAAALGCETDPEEFAEAMCAWRGEELPGATFRIDTSDDGDANPESKRQGLWTAAPGEAEGWDDLPRAIVAAEHLLAEDEFPQVASVRVVCEQTGELFYSR